MRTLAGKCFLLSIWSSISCSPAALGHVKWFLNRPESELLKQPKPALFTQLSVYNSIPLMLALVFYYVISLFNKRFSNWSGNKKLLDWAYRYEAVINLLMAVGFGASLIYCGVTHTLLVPNFVICAHCPQWLAPTEILTGCLLMFGLGTRPAVLAIFSLMYMALAKHGLVECLDALPLLGLAIYFMINGRGRYSLDYIWDIDRTVFPLLLPFVHSIIRWMMGIGLIILALDEKLLHPQLAISLLQYFPALDPLRSLGCDNAMFVLVTGLLELLLGMCVLFGVFPRIAVMVLLVTFSVTTAIFGWEEFFGHAACYSILLSILFWGAVSPELAWRSVKVLAHNLREYFQVNEILEA